MNRNIQQELQRLGFMVPSEQFKGFHLVRNGLSMYLSPVVQAVTAALIRANGYRPPRLYLEAVRGVPTLELTVNEDLEVAVGNPAVDERTYCPLFRSPNGLLFCIDSQDPNPDDPAVYRIRNGGSRFRKVAKTLSEFLKRAYSEEEANWLLRNSRQGHEFADIRLYCQVRNGGS